MFYILTKVMKTFFIQLVFTNICLSNAKFSVEKDDKVQRQRPLENKNDTTWDAIMGSWNKTFLSNQNFELGEYAPEHGKDGIMDSWDKTFWSNQNFEHGESAPEHGKLEHSVAQPT